MDENFLRELINLEKRDDNFCVIQVISQKKRDAILYLYNISLLWRRFETEPRLRMIRGAGCWQPKPINAWLAENFTIDTSIEHRRKRKITTWPITYWPILEKENWWTFYKWRGTLGLSILMPAAPWSHPDAIPFGTLLPPTRCRNRIIANPQDICTSSITQSAPAPRSWSRISHCSSACMLIIKLSGPGRQKNELPVRAFRSYY